MKNLKDVRELALWIFRRCASQAGEYKCRDSEAGVLLMFKSGRRTSMTAAEKAKGE